jgi:ABC-2 type transport system permease protein
MSFNGHAIRTIWTSLATPVITTSLYFVVFGAAIGSRMGDVGGVTYAAFIVPGLIMLALFTESIFNASFGIVMPKWSGTIYELLSAPVSSMETVLAYVGAAATKSVILGLVILATASLFVDIAIQHPFWMVTFLGGAFQSIDMLPAPWRTVTLFNPIVYLISGFRWSLYGTGDVSMQASLAALLLFLMVCLAILAWIFRTGYRLKS